MVTKTFTVGEAEMNQSGDLVDEMFDSSVPDFSSSDHDLAYSSAPKPRRSSSLRPSSNSRLKKRVSYCFLPLFMVEHFLSIYLRICITKGGLFHGRITTVLHFFV